MTTEEIGAVLLAAAQMRFPRVHGLEVGEKIAAVEDYLIETAIARGELAEARLHTQASLVLLLDEWDEIMGWETLLPSGGRITQDDIRRAKKTIRPDLHGGINAGKRLVARLSDQIHRLELDDKAASRAYTMMTGS